MIDSRPLYRGPLRGLVVVAAALVLSSPLFAADIEYFTCGATDDAVRFAFWSKSTPCDPNCESCRDEYEFYGYKVKLHRMVNTRFGELKLCVKTVEFPSSSPRTKVTNGSINGLLPDTQYFFNLYVQWDEGGAYELAHQAAFCTDL